MLIRLASRFLYCLCPIIASSLTVSDAIAHEQVNSLPAPIQENLSRIDGKWRFVSCVAIVAPDGRKLPDVVRGDFDGNGQADYAVYIVASKGPVDRRQRLIVFLKNEDQYLRRTVSREAPNTMICLFLFKKGTKDFRYDTREYFRYKYDTVGLFSETAGYSYMYWRGRFYRVITSD